MKIYLAGGFPIMLVRGRERRLSSRISPYRRLYSYWFKEAFEKSEILQINYENIFSNMVIRRESGILPDKK